MEQTTHLRVYKSDAEKIKSKDLALRLNAESTPKIIAKLLENSSFCNLNQSNYNRLVSLLNKYAFENIDAVVKFLLDQHEQSNRKLCTIDSIMLPDDKTPRLITGNCGSGKTFWVRTVFLKYLKEMNIPTLIIDPLKEFEGVEQVGFDIFKFDLETYTGILRYIPHEYSNIALTEVGNLFSTFEMRSNCLKRWCVIIEESESYKDVPSVVKWVYESRHRNFKCVCVSSKPDSYEGVPVLEVKPYKLDIEMNTSIQSVRNVNSR
jgi:hypothetical protein